MLSLEQANVIITATLQKGHDLNLKPLCVTVLDPGGHIIALARQDGASNLRPRIASAKAGGALALGVSSRAIGEMATERPAFVASLVGICAAGLVPAAGGLLITNDRGALVGAIGVTGDTSENDELCARVGVEAAGFVAIE